MLKPFSLDPKLRQLIDSLRLRIRRYIVWDSLLAVAAVLLAAFWGGLALDYGPVLLGGTEMPSLARFILLLIVAALVLAIVVRRLIGRLLRSLPDDSLALLLERRHPELGGRLMTTIQLNQSGRSGDSHAPELLRRVHDETAQAIDRVDPMRVFSWRPMIRKAAIVLPLGLSAIVLLIISPQAFGLAVSRLTLLSDAPWPRRAQLEMVGVELPVVLAAEDDTAAPTMVPFQDRTVRLPRASNGTLRIRAKADDAEVPVVCTVYYRTDEGTRGQSNMRRIGRVVDGYQAFVLDGPPLAGLSDSLTLSVRGLDDRLDDYRIEAVQPPVITEMDVAVRYPEYLRSEGASEFDLKTTYQAGLRLREGSDVVLTASSSVPLGQSDVVLRTDSGQNERVELVLSEDSRQGQIAIDHFGRSTTIRIVPRDQDGISAQAAYRYYLGVISDEPPDLKLRLKGIGSAVTPIARIPVEVDAKDDYGLESLSVSISLMGKREAEDSTTSEPETATVQLTWDRQGNADQVIDLRDFTADGVIPELAPEESVSIYAEATDGYDLAAPHLTRSEMFRLQVVTPEKLLALLERRELALRARLEQTIDETRSLRDTLALLRRRGFQNETDDTADTSDPLRAKQIRLLRVQQTLLQANKTSEELTGIAASLDDVLQEMINNRVDSADRRERIGSGVRDPLSRIVEGPLAELKTQIREIEQSIDTPDQATEKTVQAVQTAEEVLLQLTAVLEKMLDLESYNEILDMVRELIEDQKGLLDETKAEQKKRLMDLFN